MTISTTASRISYNGNGVTVAFSFPYRFLQNADLVVIRVAADGTETTLVLGTDYTVAGADDDAGGTVTCTVAPVTGSRLVIYRSVEITQEVDYITGDSFPAETHERALDRLTMVAQQLQDAVDRSAKLPETSTADADALVADLIRLADSADNIDTVATSIADVNTVADNIVDIQNAEENADAAALSAAAAATSAANAASSASSASTSASAASTSASAADTSATNASASETNAATSATAAASSATAAASSASSASTSATNAASSASAASTSATNAANSATAAAASETNAAGSATDAATSATASASSASAAAASAASAAALLDNFDDRYLGSKSTAPTLDNDGNALIAGALYFNDGTVVEDDKGMWAYDGSSWIKASSASQAILVTYEYVATAGQTTFSGNDANGVSLSYTVGSIIVTLNGVRLRPGDDYTASTGTSVVLSVAAALNDEVVIDAFTTFDVANTYTQAQVDAALATKMTASGPAFSAYSASSQNLSNATTTKIQLDAELFDTSNCFDSTTSYRFTPNVSGYYQINANITLGSSGWSSSYANAYIYKNGSLFAASGIQPNNGNWVLANISCLVYMNGSTDFIELYSEHNGATTNPLGTITGYIWTYMNASLVRAA
jgi:hypothetical protein